LQSRSGGPLLAPVRRFALMPKGKGRTRDPLRASSFIIIYLSQVPVKESDPLLPSGSEPNLREQNT